MYKYLSDKNDVFVDLIERGDKYYVKANPPSEIEREAELVADIPNLEPPPKKYEEEYSTKMEEIGARFDHLKEIELQRSKIRDVLLDARVSDAVKSYLDQLDERERMIMENGFDFLTDRFIGNVLIGDS